MYFKVFYDYLLVQVSFPCVICTIIIGEELQEKGGGFIEKPFFPSLSWKFLRGAKAKYALKYLENGTLSTALFGSLCNPECAQSTDLTL